MCGRILILCCVFIVAITQSGCFGLIVNRPTEYSWPGNIRELENFIERAVLLSQTTDLEVPVSELKRPTTAADRAAVSLEDAERQHILNALHQARWIIGGQAGAAAKLGIKRTTLNAKIQKLGISRPR